MTHGLTSDCYCVILRGISRRITALYDEALAPVGISVAQFALLRRIRRAQPVSLTELARLSDLDRSTVGRNVRVLERDGHVRSVAARDQREQALELTPAGEKVLVDGAPFWDAAQARVEELIGPAGGETLRALLRAL